MALPGPAGSFACRFLGVTEPAEQPRHGGGDPLRLAVPRLDDVEARRARAAVASRIFGGPREPVRVGRYQVLGRIGKGGMGVVYRARDAELARDVAVKLMNPEAVGDAEATARARLVREARAMARLAHPNVIHVYDVGAVEDGVFIAMELVEGESLATRLARAPMDWREVLRDYIAAGRGLAAAHAAGIVHRDFKPENVLVGSDGRVRVGDFGLAGSPATLEVGSADDVPLAATSLADPSGSLTRTGALLGTPKYIAPELERGAMASARSDQFSFCVALYEGLYGCPPFAGDTVARYRREVRAGRVVQPPPGSRVPAWVAAALFRGLEVDPAARHAGLAALLDELERALVDPRTLRSAWRRQVVLAPLLAGAVGLGVVLGLGAGERRNDGDGALPTAASEPEAAPADASREPDRVAVAPSPAAPRSDARVATADPRVPARDAKSPPVASTEARKATPAEPRPRTGGRRHCYFHEDEKTRLADSAGRRSLVRSEAEQCYQCRRTKDAWTIDTLNPKDDCGWFYLCRKEDDDACAQASPG